MVIKDSGSNCTGNGGSDDDNRNSPYQQRTIPFDQILNS